MHGEGRCRNARCERCYPRDPMLLIGLNKEQRAALVILARRNNWVGRGTAHELFGLLPDQWRELAHRKLVILAKHAVRISRNGKALVQQELVQ